jgi:hypothetical protein
MNSGHKEHRAYNHENSGNSTPGHGRHNFRYGYPLPGSNIYSPGAGSYTPAIATFHYSSYPHSHAPIGLPTSGHLSLGLSP